MQTINTENISIDKISIPTAIERNIAINVLRLDQLHPIISGNKWFKLRYYIAEAKTQNKNTIVTFGGAWSNHIIATAAICNNNGFNSIGLIRGEEADTLSPTLLHAKQLGMELIFLSRNEYQQKMIPLAINNSSILYIPEGGYGKTGAAGATTMLDFCDKEEYTHICCAAGTGTMAAGLLNSMSNKQELIVISALKNYLPLEEKINEIVDKKEATLHVNHNYHFGGYAKQKPELIQFMNSFYAQTKIPTDFVYTGKLCFGIIDMIKNDHFKNGSKLLVIHSGGLQGNASLEKGTLIF